MMINLFVLIIVLVLELKKNPCKWSILLFNSKIIYYSDICFLTQLKQSHYFCVFLGSNYLQSIL